MKNNSKTIKKYIIWLVVLLVLFVLSIYLKGLLNTGNNNTWNPHAMNLETLGFDNDAIMSVGKYSQHVFPWEDTYYLLLFTNLENKENAQLYIYGPDDENKVSLYDFKPLGLDFDVKKNPIIRNILDLNNDKIAEVILEFEEEDLKKYIVVNFDPILKEIKFHKAPNQDARAIYIDGEMDGSIYSFKVDEENGMYIQRKMDKDEGAFKDFFLRLVPFSSMLYYANLEN